MHSNKKEGVRFFESVKNFVQMAIIYRGTFKE